MKRYFCDPTNNTVQGSRDAEAHIWALYCQAALLGRPFVRQEKDGGLMYVAPGPLFETGAIWLSPDGDWHWCGEQSATRVVVVLPEDDRDSGDHAALIAAARQAVFGAPVAA